MFSNHKAHSHPMIGWQASIGEMLTFQRMSCVAKGSSIYCDSGSAESAVLIEPERVMLALKLRCTTSPLSALLLKCAEPEMSYSPGASPFHCCSCFGCATSQTCTECVCANRLICKMQHILTIDYSQPSDTRD